MSSSGSAQQVLEGLKAGDNFLLLAHVHPDGDSIGSLLALADLLRQLGKRVTIASEEEIPATYRFIEGTEGVKIGTANLADHYDQVVALDVSDRRRVGSLHPYLESATTVINIDHHLGNEFASPKYVRTTACATGELVYELFELAGLAPSPAAAVALYTAIVTDTGRFSHANTTASSFRIAAKLVEWGVDTHWVFSELYQRKDLGFIRLLGVVLANLQSAFSGQVAYIVLDRKLLSDYAPDMGDTEQYISYAQMIEGVKVALLFREVDDSHTKVSWRSIPGVDVSVFARHFGGGGHANAAGCELELEPKLAVSQILDFLQAHFC